METGENVKLIFKRALEQYNRVLDKLKTTEEFNLGNGIIQENIQDNIDKNTRIIESLDSTDGLSTVKQYRLFLCQCLQGYITYLEATKISIVTNLQNNLSFPVIDLTKIDAELELAKKIREGSCDHNGYT